MVPVLSMDAPSQARTVTLCKDLQAMSAAFLTDSCKLCVAVGGLQYSDTVDLEIFM